MKADKKAADKEATIKENFEQKETDGDNEANEETLDPNVSFC